MKTYSFSARVVDASNVGIEGATITATLNRAGYIRADNDATLLELANSPATIADEKMQDLLVTADGKYLYSINNAPGADGGKVYGYAIDARTGEITPLLDSPWSTTDGGNNYAIIQAGQYIYVASTDSPDNAGISAFKMVAGGRLQNINSGTVFTDLIPSAFAAHGQFLYVMDATANTVVVLTIQADGSLKKLKPETHSLSSMPYGAAITESGRYLYVACLGSNHDGAIDAFQADGAGTLNKIGSFQVAAGMNCSDVTVFGNSSVYCVSSSETPECYTQGFHVQPDGSLVEMDESPWPVPHSPQKVAVSRDGAHVYTSIDDARLISIYKRSPTGDLTPASVQNIAVEGYIIGITVGPSSDYLYATYYQEGEIASFAINNYNAVVIPQAISQTTDTDGMATLSLIACNDYNNSEIYYAVTVKLNGNVVASQRLNMPRHSFSIGMQV